MISKIYETENKTIYNNSRKPKDMRKHNMKLDNKKHDLLMFPKESNTYLENIYLKIKNENPMP